MELLLRVLKWSVLAGAVTALVTLTKPLLDRRFTPRWRYWLWLVLAAALLLSPVSPGSLFPALPEPAVTVTAPEVRVPVPKPSRPAPEAPGTPDEPVTPNATPAAPAAPEPPRAGTAERRTVELSALLTAAWLLGAAVFALWHILGTALLVSRLRRWSVPAGGGAVSLCRELSKELGLRRAPQVCVSRSLASPLVAGLFRPRLWLPDRAWEERELSFILRHELTHLKRRDLWYKALMLLANALHWFNPLVWLLRREAGETAELLCDAQALSGADRETRRAYCEALLEHICRVPGAALTTHFYGGKHSVKARFQNLLSGRKRRFGWTAFACCVLAVAVTACAVGVAVSDSVKPEDFDGKYTASLYKYVSLRDETGGRIQNKAVLISSPDELDELRRYSGIEPIDDGNRVVNGDLTEKLDSYDRDYFRENVLAVLIFENGSGSFELAVEGVAVDGDALAVTLSETNPNAPDTAITMDLCQWCILVECRRVEGVTSVRWSFASVPDTDPDPTAPEDSPLPERIGETLLESPSGVVMKVNWRGDVTNYVMTDEYLIRDIRDALAGLSLSPSGAASCPEDELTILLESGDGLCGARLGKSGPLELIWEGASTFWELPDSQHQALWEELAYLTQLALDDSLFAGITVDGSLSMDEAAAAIAERMAENLLALPGWVKWKPLDARSLGAGVFDAYLGEPQNFCAGVSIALKLSADDPAEPGRNYWESGSGLPEEPIDGGELDGYYEWGRGMDVLRNPDGDWELAGVYTGGGGVEIPGWSYSSGAENSFDRATAEDLLRLYTLTEGEFHRFAASLLSNMTPEELQDLPTLLPLLTKAQARELHDLVADVSDDTAPARALLFEALADYIGQ